MVEENTALAAAEEAKAQLPDAVVKIEQAVGEVTLYAVAAQLPQLVAFLRDAPLAKFTTLVDIASVDYPGRDKRFDVVYHFLSMPLNHRIRVKIAVREDEPAPTLTKLYPAADWYEREIFDMHGVPFSGHPDLRRILTDYGFSGFPLRKDFPTTGFVELRYDEAQKRVVYEPVTLVQEYRQFDFMSPWEGAEYILPGDEKTEGAA